MNSFFDLIFPHKVLQVCVLVFEQIAKRLLRYIMMISILYFLFTFDNCYFHVDGCNYM